MTFPLTPLNRSFSTDWLFMRYSTRRLSLTLGRMQASKIEFVSFDFKMEGFML